MTDILQNEDNFHDRIIDSKLEPNRPNIELLNRQRILVVLDEALKRSVIFIVAPAGFGKSSLTYQWGLHLTQNDVISSWVSLDENDIDIRQFLSYIALSLAKSGLEIGNLDVGARNGFAESQVGGVLLSILDCIGRSLKHVVLFLDDYHRPKSTAIDNTIRDILKLAPSNLTLVISSRETPAFNIPQLIASGDASVLDAELMRLTPEETSATLGEMISAKDAKAIYQQTEGWPVAVQLARVNKQANPTVAIEQVSSSHLVASYLTNQVLLSMDQDLREFLLSVSILDQFNTSLANKVRGKEDSAQIINRLDTLRAFLVTTDYESGWYRLHHLFAEYLQETLHLETPKLPDIILNRASDWHFKHGNLIDAVSYAAKAKAYAKCEELILNAGGWKIILRDGIGVIRNIFRIIPEHIISASGRLLIARAYLHCKDGEYKEARGILDSSQALRLDEDCHAYDKDHILVEALVGLYEDKGDWAQSRSQDTRLETDKSFTPLELGTLYCQHTLVDISLSNFSAAQENIKSSLQCFRESGSALGLNYTYLHAAVEAMYRAEFDLARAYINRALELADSNFGSDSGLKHLAVVLDFSLKVWSGQASSVDLDAFSSALSQTEENDGWTEVYMIGLHSIFALAEQIGDHSFSNNLVDRFLFLARRRDLERLESFASVLQLRAAYNQGRQSDIKKYSNQIKQWMNVSTLENSPRFWQSYYQAAITLASNMLMSDALGAEVIRVSVEHSEKSCAKFYQIQLNIAKALVMDIRGRHEDSLDVFLETLKAACDQKIMGPFLYANGCRKLLRASRDRLRYKNDDLILLNFVTDIISKSEDLRPIKSSALLSVREREILEHLSQGQSNKEIARRFELTENTVKFHLKSIYKKLSVNSRAQAVIVAGKMNLLD